MKRKILSFIFSLTLLLTFVGVRPVYADSAVVGTGTPASCTEAALNAAVAELYPGATAPGGVLSFNCGPNPHTIVVTSQKALYDGSVIDGGGLITLSGNNNTRIFFVTNQARVELRHLHLINGYAAGGGAIFVEPNFSGDFTYLTLDDVTFNNNNSTNSGGAIWAQHTVLGITNSHFTGNSSGDGGGAISLNEGTLTLIASEVLGNASKKAGSTGGGLNVWNATLDIQTSTLRNNVSLLSEGGAIALNYCSGTIANSLIDQNTGKQFGGGLYLSNGSLTLSKVTLTNNTANNGGGIVNTNNTLVLDGATILSGNTATQGAGIYNFQGQVTAQNAGFVNNAAVVGGGISNHLGTLALTDVTFSGNSAPSGGGVYNNGQTTLTRVTMLGNTAGDGGAIFNTDTGILALVNATLSENQANFGGGVFNNGTLSLTNVTIAKNTAGGGGGGLLHNSGLATHLTMVNTLFSANTAPAANNSQCLLYEAPESQLFSLWQGVSCGNSSANGNQPNVDVVLAPLGFTGTGLPSELTMTHALLPLSPAMDAGTCNGAPTKDQRGVARPQGAACDIGAFEAKVTIFADVPGTYWAHGYIERLYNAGVTSGCSTVPLNYCPTAPVTRAQMAIFLLRSKNGSTYSPPVIVSTRFADVPGDYWSAAWIEQLAADGITGGCGPNIYCPDSAVTRAQMAVFLLRGKHGAAYIPPAATGVFSDVPLSYWAVAWIEQLAKEGITSGCGPGTYCPENTVTRDQMAVFLVKTFNLP